MFAATSFLLLSWISQSLAWQTTRLPVSSTAGWFQPSLQQKATTSTTQLQLFDKLFEEEGILGKGITVGKVQIALNSPNRGPNSIFGILEKEANDDKTLPELTHAICLALLRKSDEWIGAAGTGQWFSGNDAGKAESLFNDFANKEATKFEKVSVFCCFVAKNYIQAGKQCLRCNHMCMKWATWEPIANFVIFPFQEYIPDEDDEEGGGATIVVVSLVIEIEGDSTK